MLNEKRETNRFGEVKYKNRKPLHHCYNGSYKASIGLGYVNWTFNMGCPFWFMDAVAQLATTASDSARIYTETNPIVFLSHVIVPRHDR